MKECRESQKTLESQLKQLLQKDGQKMTVRDFLLKNSGETQPEPKKEKPYRRVCVRLSHEEYKAVQEIAKFFGVKMHAFIKQQILRGTKDPRKRKQQQQQQGDTDESK